MRRFLLRLRTCSARSRDEEVTREINAHLALLEDEYRPPRHDRGRGAPRCAARARQRRARGGSASRRAHVRLDRRPAARHRPRPSARCGGRRGFTAVAVITLALGIGANTAIFSVVSAVLLRPLPYHDADRLVQVFAPPPNVRAASDSRAGARASARVFRAAAQRERARCRTWPATSSTSATLTGQGDAVRLPALQMTASVFPMLGVPPMLGRPFDDREEAAGADAVVVLSHAAWQRYFNSDPGVVGRVIALDGRGRTVVGVMPREIRLSRRARPVLDSVCAPAATRRAAPSSVWRRSRRLREGVATAGGRGRGQR